MADTVIILDFGGQYTQLIARRVRQAKVLSQVLPYWTKPEEIAALRDERDALRAAIPQARLRLDALRLIASPDFLGLRG